MCFGNQFITSSKTIQKNKTLSMAIEKGNSKTILVY